MAITLHAVTAGGGSRLLLRPWLAADMGPLLQEMAREYPRRGRRRAGPGHRLHLAQRPAMTADDA